MDDAATPSGMPSNSGICGLSSESYKGIWQSWGRVGFYFMH